MKLQEGESFVNELNKIAEIVSQVEVAFDKDELKKALEKNSKHIRYASESAAKNEQSARDALKQRTNSLLPMPETRAEQVVVDDDYADVDCTIQILSKRQSKAH